MRKRTFTLPIREATAFLLTGNEVNILKLILDALPKLLRNARRHDSICLYVNFPGSNA
jgi:hypothetical protein